MTEDVIDAEVVEEEAPSQALVVRAPAPVSLFHTNDPREVIERATETAKPLADVIRKQKLFTKIGGKNHVQVEGWTLLGSMLGVYPICVWTKKLDNGYEARVEARTKAGELVGAAEAVCLRSESLWKSRDDYALKSMAQTRATSKALRQPLGFVIQLAGFAPEPAEEMPEPRRRKSAGEPSAAPTGRAAAGKSEDKPAASPAESPFKPPSGARGAKAETKKLAAELRTLVEKIGATDSLAAVDAHEKAGDDAWLKRQIAAATKHLEAKKRAS